MVLTLAYINDFLIAIKTTDHLVSCLNCWIPGIDGPFILTLSLNLYKPLKYHPFNFEDQKNDAHGDLKPSSRSPVDG